MKRYNLVIGPIDDDPDGLSPEDLTDALTSAGWRNVRIEWLESNETIDDTGEGVKQC